MNRLLKTLRNLLLIVFLGILFLALTGLRLSPIQAHKASERGIHYGPSKIVKVFDYGSYQHLLCTYDRWVSCNTVNKNLFFLWSAGSQPIGFENDPDKAFVYSGVYSDKLMMVYGIVNDPNITRMELRIGQDQVLVQETLYDNLFYFSWKGSYNDRENMTLTGYNDQGDIWLDMQIP